MVSKLFIMVYIYSGLDDLAAACKAMEGVEVINGLGCKMSCSYYKVNSESILKPNWYEVSCFDNLELEEPIYTYI